MQPPSDESPTSPPDASAAHPPAPKNPRVDKGVKIVRHFKIDELLAASDRAAYQALLLDPRQTVDSLHAWLVERGDKNISRGSVHRHRRHFEKDVLEIPR